MYRGRCYTRCPEQTYMVPETLNDENPTKKPQKQCSACHYTCADCDGSHDYECTRCFGESAMRKNSFNQTFCVNQPETIPLNVIATYEGVEKDVLQHQSEQQRPHITRNKLIFYILYGVFIVSITCALTVLIVRRLWRQFCQNETKKKQNYVYDRVDYMGTNEPDKIFIQNGLLHDFSDSDDADEPNI